jgi:hypothetical protein
MPTALPMFPVLTRSNNWRYPSKRKAAGQAVLADQEYPQKNQKLGALTPKKIKNASLEVTKQTYKNFV